MRRHTCLLFMALLMVAVVSFAQKSQDNAVSDEDKPSAYVQEKGTYGVRYLFGVAIGYADSTTYITNVCPVGNISYDKRTKAPIGAELYTESLKNHLLQQGKTGYLCSTFMCKSRKEAEKKLIAIRNRMMKKKRTQVLSLADFKYEYIDTEHIYSNAGQDMEDDF